MFKTKINSNQSHNLWQFALTGTSTTLSLIVLATSLLNFSFTATQPQIKVQAAESPSTTTWKKIQGLPTNAYEVKDLKEYNGKMYLLTAGYKCDTCGVFKLNEDILTWEKVLPNPGNESKDLAITSTGEFYTFGGNGTIIKYNTSSQKWEKLFSTTTSGSYPAGITINGSGRHASAAYSLTLGPDNKFYATALFPSDNKNYVITYNSTTKTWDKVGPALPDYQALTRSNQVGTHRMWDPRIAFDKTGTVFISNTEETPVAKCLNAPKQQVVNGQTVDIQPTNIVMKLKNNQWEGLSTKEKGFEAAGYTCGWGKSYVLNNKDGNIYASGGSGQYYLWNTQSEKWQLLEQNGYPDNQRRITGENIITSAPQRGGQPLIYNESFKYVVPTDIQDQDCDLFILKNFVALGQKGLISSIYNQANQNCGGGYPSPSTINGGKNDEYKTQDSINTAISKDSGTIFDRGLYYISIDQSKKTESNLKVETASYLFSGNGTNEDASSVALQDNNNVVVAANLDTSANIPANTPKFNLLGSTNNSKAKLIRLSNNGTQVTSVTTLGNKIDQVSVTPDNKIVAIGDFGLVVLNPEASQVVWSKDLGEWKKDRRIAISTDGKIASLNFKTVQVWNPDGAQAGSNIQLNDSYVEDIALDGTKGSIYIGGFNNARLVLPVQISYVYTYNFNTAQKINTTWGYPQAQMANDMADTRIYRLALSPDNSRLYAAGESAGGNTVFRWNGKDFSTSTAVNNGPGGFADLWMAKSSSHLGYLGEIDVNTGTVLRGSFNTAVLKSSNRLNTTKVRGDLDVDSNGNVYLTGTSAAHIPSKAVWSIADQKVGEGSVEDYAGADAYILILSPNLDNRVVWTTFSKLKNAGEMRSVAIRGNQAAVVGSMFKGTAITTANALQAQPGEPIDTQTNVNNDIFFSVWNTQEAL